MPAVNDTPRALRPYISFGVDLQWRHKTEPVGTCPWCQGEGKFYVSDETGQWQCKVCMEEGNIATFLRRLWEEGASGEYGGQGEALAEDRGLQEETFRAWGLVISPLSGEWLAPGFGAGGKIDQLYRLIYLNHKQRFLCGPAYDRGDGKEQGQALWGVNLYEPHKSEVWIAEGIWDGMALWETLAHTKIGDEDELLYTGNPAVSLLNTINVLAVPSAGAFDEEWLTLLKGKKVTLCFHSDHPPAKAKEGQGGAGYEGTKRLTRMMAGMTDKPKEVRWLKWGPLGYDPDRKSGYDCRDLLCKDGRGGNLPLNERHGPVSLLRDLAEPIPSEWVQGVRSGTAGSVELPPLPCDNWDVLENAYRCAYRWSEDYSRALATLLSCCLSTDLVEDQLWVKLIAPPSSLKSTLCEALSVAKDYVYAKDTFTGIVSGYQDDKDGSQNMSMVQNLKGKTLIINDGDTLLKMPNLGQILSQLRAFYGRNIRSQYGNKMSRDFENVSTSIILCGTDSLSHLDTSELGQRFLTCRVMRRFSSDVERDINKRKLALLMQHKGMLVNGDATKARPPDQIEAMRLTGGYVNFLRRNAGELLERVRVGEDVLDSLDRLARFISHLRARPSKSAEVKDTRELGARLTAQLFKLATCLAAVTGRWEVDGKVMKMVRVTARDTADGQTLDLTQALHQHRDTGLSATGVGAFLNETPEKAARISRFLQNLGTIRAVEKPTRDGRVMRRLFLSPEMLSLYGEAFADELTHGA